MRIHRPHEIETAIAARQEGATPIAGGTDLLVHWPENLTARAGSYVDLWGIESMRHTIWSEGTLEIGALTTYLDVVLDRRIGSGFPLLVDAARQVGAVQIQSRGTWAGNIANGSPAADGVPVLMAYDASVVLRSPDGERTVALCRFYSGYKEMDLRDDELIVAIRIPRATWDASRFIKVGSRRAQAIAKIGLTILRDGPRWQVVASSLAPIVKRCPAIEARLNDDVDTIRSPEDLRDAVEADTSPIDDLRSTAEYRRRVTRRALFHAVREMAP